MEDVSGGRGWRGGSVLGTVMFGSRLRCAGDYGRQYSTIGMLALDKLPGISLRVWQREAGAWDRAQWTTVVGRGAGSGVEGEVGVTRSGRGRGRA